MSKGQCIFKSRDGSRCSHQHHNLSAYCFWHDPKTRKGQPDLKQKLIALYKAGESLEGFQLKGALLDEVDLTGANLSYANLESASLVNAHLKGCNLQKANLQKANLQQANLNQADLTLADLYNVQWGQTKLERINWGDMVAQEQRAHKAMLLQEWDIAEPLFIEAEEVYRSLFKACEERGLYSESSNFYHRDRVMRRYQLPYPSIQHAFSYLVDFLCGYGEKPNRVIIFSLCITIFCAAFYAVFGISHLGNPLYLSFENTIEQNIFVISHCLYFSVVTFTTLGYGDVTPLGYAKLLASFEAFVGSFSTAVFVVVFVRKMTR